MTRVVENLIETFNKNASEKGEGKKLAHFFLSEPLLRDKKVSTACLSPKKSKVSHERKNKSLDVGLRRDFFLIDKNKMVTSQVVLNPFQSKSLSSSLWDF